MVSRTNEYIYDRVNGIIWIFFFRSAYKSVSLFILYFLGMKVMGMKRVCMSYMPTERPKINNYEKKKKNL